jgi:hypothetical protein
LNCLRRWNFCVILNMIVIMLTAMKGGDAISVCLNTVAVSPVPPPQTRDARQDKYIFQRILTCRILAAH